MLKIQKREDVHEDVHAAINKKTWDSNAITPGTPFMDILAASLRYWVAYKLNTDPAWEEASAVLLNEDLLLTISVENNNFRRYGARRGRA